MNTTEFEIYHLGMDFQSPAYTISLERRHEGKIVTIWLIQCDDLFDVRDVKEACDKWEKVPFPRMTQRQWMTVVNRWMRKSRDEQIARGESFGEPYEVTSRTKERVYE
jgi:hypothetical protein